MQQYFYIYTKKIDDRHYFLGKYSGPMLPVAELVVIKYCADGVELEGMYRVFDSRTKDDPHRIRFMPKPKPKRTLPYRPRSKTPDSVRMKISMSKKGKVYTPLQKEALRDLRKREYREGDRTPHAHWAGKRLSDQHKQNIAASRYQRERPKKNCPYCGKYASVNMLERWHNNRCPTKALYY